MKSPVSSHRAEENRAQARAIRVQADPCASLTFAWGRNTKEDQAGRSSTWYVPGHHESRCGDEW